MTASIHQPTRSDDFLNADFWTQRGLLAAHRGNTVLAADAFRRAQEFRDRALKTPDSGGLAAAGASLPVIGG